MDEAADPYLGREHSKIKHLFLAEYLKSASFKVLQGIGAARTCTYVDGFAGPWSVADENECTDSSFDYAVRILLDTRTALEKAGRSAPKLRFLLCERDPDAFQKLKAYAAKKVGLEIGLEIEVFAGDFEDNLDAIRARCEGFTFSFIDPKGWNLRSAEIASFLASVRGDFLLNFMEHPVSRHNSYEKVRASFARLLDDAEWHLKIDTAHNALPRETQILALLKKRLKAQAAAKYMPDFPILKPSVNRVQMRLVLGTHHFKGVEVFRTVEDKLQQVQLTLRRNVSEGGAMLLLSDDQMNQVELGKAGVGSVANRAAASTMCRELMSSIDGEVTLENLAARVMEAIPLRLTHMKDVATGLRNDGFLTFQLQGTARKPSEETKIRRAAI